MESTFRSTHVHTPLVWGTCEDLLLLYTYIILLYFVVLWSVLEVLSTVVCVSGALWSCTWSCDFVNIKKLLLLQKKTPPMKFARNSYNDLWFLQLVAGSGSSGSSGSSSGSGTTDPSGTDAGTTGDSGRTDGAQEAVPGPVTRLFVIANRGISNLIQDLILVSILNYSVIESFNICCYIYQYT